MKKIVIIILCLFIFFPHTAIFAQENNFSINQNESISPRADKLVWKYKVINGSLYKRLWNQSKGKWIGNWVPC